ncbi:MAG: hypothetical protein WHU10_10350, partial [Fimbriimonadales bacterium]
MSLRNCFGRLFGIVVVGLCAVASWADPVDVAIPAMPLEKAVRLLSQSLGQRLEVSRELASEVVLVRASGVEPNELLDRIAQTLGASWREDGSRRTLVLTDAQRREQREAELAWRERATEAAIRRLSEPLAKHPTFDADAIEAARQAGRTPTSPGGTFSPMAMAQL